MLKKLREIGRFLSAVLTIYLHLKKIRKSAKIKYQQIVIFCCSKTTAEIM
jgi:hypothetical protein